MNTTTTENSSIRKGTFADRLQKEMEIRKTQETGILAILTKLNPFQAK